MLSIIIRCGFDPDHTICPPAATCGKSGRARIGNWEQVGQFLHGIQFHTWDSSIENTFHGPYQVKPKKKLIFIQNFVLYLPGIWCHINPNCDVIFTVIIIEYRFYTKIQCFYYRVSGQSVDFIQNSFKYSVFFEPHEIFQQG